MYYGVFLPIAILWQFSAHGEESTITLIENLRNVGVTDVICSPAWQDSSLSADQIFWKINGMPYGVSEVPPPFTLGAYRYSLVVPAVSALDGFLLQCIGIAWGNGSSPTREVLGSKTRLMVAYLYQGKPMSLYISIEQGCMVILLILLHVAPDYLELDYQNLLIGSDALNMRALPHPSQNCQPLVLPRVELFRLDQVSNIFNTSQIAVSIVPSSLYDAFVVQWENVSNGQGFVFRFKARSCLFDMTKYYLLQPSSEYLGGGGREGGCVCVCVREREMYVIEA